jgi:hypothetical protein
MYDWEEELMPFEIKRKIECIFAEIPDELEHENEDLREKMQSISRMLENMVGLDKKRSGWQAAGRLANSDVSNGEGLGFVLGEPSNPHRESYQG